MNTTISESDRKALESAKYLLENPGLAIKIANMIGSPIEKSFNRLPKKWVDKIEEITKTALLKASDIALFTIKDTPGEQSSNKWHKAGVAVSGGIGGFFGFAALAIELPVSTTIILRSIADIARSYGESITTPETKLACLEVFALGGTSKSDESAEHGYFAVRAILSKSISEAAEYIAEKGFAEKSAPVILKLIIKIAQRFGVQITEKAAAQAIPAIGAAGGVIINTIFIEHFQDMAKGHFTVRKLERTYGREKVKKLYAEI